MEEKEELTGYDFVLKAAGEVLRMAREKIVNEVPPKGRYKDPIVARYPADKQEGTHGYSRPDSCYISFLSPLPEKINPDRRFMDVGVTAFGYSRGGTLCIDTVENLKSFLDDMTAEGLAGMYWGDFEHLCDDDNIHR